jgi:V8-like Glu-specific endopeptidase
MPLFDFSYLSVDELHELEDAFIARGVTYDKPLRDQLLNGVNRLFVVNFLPITGADPATQLASDLMEMNRFERLTDGTVPLAQWLRNTIRRFRQTPEQALFEKALSKVTAAGETATANAAPPDTPAIDFEEIITDDVDDLQDVAFLLVGAQRLPAIAKILVPRFANGQTVKLADGVSPSIGAGTGWLIGSDLLVTNYHVIRNRLATELEPAAADIQLQVQGAKAQFFYDAAEAAGRAIAIQELVAVGKEPTADFALLRLKEKPNIPALPISNAQVILPQPVQTPKGTIAKALAVNIIQHPGGGPKRVALRNNLVYSAEYPKLSYFTDTLGGSSGAPVFDDSWRVIALHRAAVPERAIFNGKVLGYVNQGIQMHAILAALEKLAADDAQVKAALEQINEEQKAYT